MALVPLVWRIFELPNLTQMAISISAILALPFAAICSQLQTGPHAMPVIGTQAMVALILTVVQGWGPALTLLPAIDRAAGMIGAILLLFAVNFVSGQPSKKHFFFEKKKQKTSAMLGHGRLQHHAHGLDS